MADTRHARLPRDRVREGLFHHRPFQRAAASLDRFIENRPRHWGRPVTQAWQFAGPAGLCKHKWGPLRRWHTAYNTAKPGIYANVVKTERHLEYEWWFWTVYHTGDWWLDLRKKSRGMLEYENKRLAEEVRALKGTVGRLEDLIMDEGYEQDWSDDDEPGRWKKLPLE